ncbi:MAG: beta strand repeat-containing protein, partial [Gammaproteobacteria bacterium]
MSDQPAIQISFFDGPDSNDAVGVNPLVDGGGIRPGRVAISDWQTALGQLSSAVTSDDNEGSESPSGGRDRWATIENRDQDKLSLAEISATNATGDELGVCHRAPGVADNWQYLAASLLAANLGSLPSYNSSTGESPSVVFSAPILADGSSGPVAESAQSLGAKEGDEIASFANASINRSGANGNAASVVTESQPTQTVPPAPNLSVNATNPSDVTFTVSDLGKGYSGTVTFTDVSGSKDVVPIASNGTYSTNLSNLTDGTIDYTLSVSNAAGNVITVDPPLNLGDGSANAPSGTPQLATLLSGYAARPSWNVAGVNYYVGVPAGTVLHNPATISMAGVSVNTTSRIVTVTGNNITLNGYDFSLNGGWQVDVEGSNDTIENSNFQIGSNTQLPLFVEASASNATIIGNTINGAGLVSSYPGYGLVILNGTGTTTVEYNIIENAYSEDIVLGSATTTGDNAIIQYNLIENAGMGASQGAHGDWIQTYNGVGDVLNNLQINFNTFVQSIPSSEGATQGLSIASANTAQGSILSATISNNTLITASGSNVSYPIILNTANLDGSATIGNNYFDPTGLNGGAAMFAAANYDGTGAGTGPYNGAVATLNNINMVTGAYYAQNVTSVTEVTSSPSTGTEVPGDTITLTLDFSAAVTVTGTPTLTLNDGGVATYMGGS